MKLRFLFFLLFAVIISSCKDTKKASGGQTSSTPSSSSTNKFVSNNGLISFDFPKDWQRLPDEATYAVFQHAKKPLGKFFITGAKVSGSKPFNLESYINDERSANLKNNPVNIVTKHGLPLLYFSKNIPGTAGVKDNTTKFFSGKTDFLIMAHYLVNENQVNTPEYKRDLDDILKILNTIVLP